MHVNSWPSQDHLCGIYQSSSHSSVGLVSVTGGFCAKVVRPYEVDHRVVRPLAHMKTFLKYC